MQLNPPPAATAATFLANVERLAGTNGSILLAVSGGPDSLAMLLLANAVMPERIVAATVDHGLRPEAAAEAAFVAKICAELDVSHAILRPGTRITGNIQSQARDARYKVLLEHCEATGCHWLATAHHADDQLETILMRLARGSGVDGMASIRAQNGPVIRPMLEFSKSDLEAICDNAGMQTVNDPSNDNIEFDRVAMRKWLSSCNHPFDPSRASRTARSMAEASEALGWIIDRLIDEGELVHGKGTVEFSPTGWPNEIRRRMLRLAIAIVEPSANPRGDAIDRALSDLAASKRFTLGNVLCEGVVEDAKEIWHFRLAPPRRQ